MRDKQDAQLRAPREIPDYTHEPDPEEMYHQKEPNEYDSDDSEDARNLIITADNYPCNEFELDTSSAEDDTESESEARDSNADDGSSEASDDETENEELGKGGGVSELQDD
jgi:hypothetical protein